jgi:hypothetical protein
MRQALTTDTLPVLPQDQIVLPLKLLIPAIAVVQIPATPDTGHIESGA